MKIVHQTIKFLKTKYFQKENFSLLNQLPLKSNSPISVFWYITKRLRKNQKPTFTLGSYVTTTSDVFCKLLIKMTIGLNFVVHGAYHVIENIHQDIIQMIITLLHAPKNVKPFGFATNGSSEALLLALNIHKHNKNTKKPNIVLTSAVHTKVDPNVKTNFLRF